MSVCRQVVGSGRGGRVLWGALWVVAASPAFGAGERAQFFFLIGAAV